jgi:hypothetical protein
LYQNNKFISVSRLSSPLSSLTRLHRSALAWLFLSLSLFHRLFLGYIGLSWKNYHWTESIIKNKDGLDMGDIEWKIRNIRGGKKQRGREKKR